MPSLPLAPRLRRLPALVRCAWSVGPNRNPPRVSFLGEIEDEVVVVDQRHLIAGVKAQKD